MYVYLVHWLMDIEYVYVLACFCALNPPLSSPPSSYHSFICLHSCLACATLSCSRHDTLSRLTMQHRNRKDYPHPGPPQNRRDYPHLITRCVDATAVPGTMLERTDRTQADRVLLRDIQDAIVAAQHATSSYLHPGPLDPTTGLPYANEHVDDDARRRLGW